MADSNEEELRSNQQWNPEADRFVENMIQHIRAVYGGDPRWSHLLLNQTMKVVKKLTDDARSKSLRTDGAFIGEPDLSNGRSEQHWARILEQKDQVTGYPAHPLQPLESNAVEALMTLSTPLATERAPYHHRGATQAASHFSKASSDAFSAAAPYPIAGHQHRYTQPSFASSESTSNQSSTAQPPPIAYSTDSQRLSGVTQHSYSSYETTSSEQSMVAPPHIRYSRESTVGGESTNRKRKVTFDHSSTRNVAAKTKGAFTRFSNDSTTTSLRRSSASTSLSTQSSIFPPGNFCPAPRLQPPSRDPNWTRDELEKQRQQSEPGEDTEEERIPALTGQPSKAASTNMQQPFLPDPVVSFYIPHGYPTNMPMPAALFDRITRQYPHWTSLRDNCVKSRRPKDWRSPSERYAVFCVECHVQGTQRARGMCFEKSYRLTDVRSRKGEQVEEGGGRYGQYTAHPQQENIVACGRCIKKGSPCVKAEMQTFVAEAGVVGTKLKLWVLPLPRESRERQSPADEAFWVLV